MRSPALHELPPPPAGKTGWPWTESGGLLPEVMPDGRPWPVVSIVTPSYNQGPYIEATIRSVLLQGYPNLEFIVVDGGSTDESVEMIRKYEKWLTCWVSERDHGQADAINKGFSRANGEIFAWLNSDDFYERHALARVLKYFAGHPECSLLYGNGWYVDEAGNRMRPCHWIKPYNRRLFYTMNFILQPAAFWRRLTWERTGGLDVNLRWAMDWEWLLRATVLSPPHYLPVDLACWRIRPDIKTNSGGWLRRAEIAAICRRYGGIWQPTYILYQLERLVGRITAYFGSGLTGQIARFLLGSIPWMLKITVWRGRSLF